jgi:hypothetical protein
MNNKQKISTTSGRLRAEKIFEKDATKETWNKATKEKRRAKKNQLNQDFFKVIPLREH